MKKTELTTMVAMMTEQAKAFGIVEELIASLQCIDTVDTVATKTVKNTAPKSTPVKVESKATPKSDSKEYGLPVFKADSKFVIYTNADGSYLKHKGIRQVLNARIKDLGGTWNAEVRAWEFSSVAKAKACVKNIDRVVSSEQLDGVAQTWKAQAQAKAVRKSTRK